MHQPIQDHLEDYLRDPGDHKVPREFGAHLAACQSCEAEVRVLSAHRDLLRTLRTSGEFEPAPGFYAKVMSRVEQSAAPSIWSVFVDPAFGRRLALASGALVLLLGTYLVTSDPIEHTAAPSGLARTYDQPGNFEDGSVRPQQRDEVLANLASFRE